MLARQIIHLDMDAFFASVEVRDQPALRGTPVVVGGGMHRGVVCSASYEARVYGVHNAMPMAQALRLCPQATIVAPRHKHYAEISAQVFAIFARYSPLVEGLSLDEAFIDVSGSQALFGDGEHIARTLQALILAETELTSSAGVAPCKFVAKIASDLRKPHGLVVVRPEELNTFLDPLPVERMWGVGKVAAARLHTLGLRRMGDIRRCPPDHLVRTLGDWGVHLWKLAHGDDPRPVVPDEAAKSISAESTFDSDVTDLRALHPTLLRHALRVTARARDSACCGRTVVVKLKDSEFRIETRRRSLREPIDDADTLYEHAKALLPRFGMAGKPIRLCGVGLTDLQSGGPPRSLFPDPVQARRQKLEAVRAQVSARFGESKLTRASLLRPDTDSEN